jgi:hypothetical protein
MMMLEGDALSVFLDFYQFREAFLKACALFMFECLSVERLLRQAEEREGKYWLAS